MTAAMSAGVGVAMMVVAVVPASAFTFDTRQQMRPQVQYGVTPNQRVARAATKETKEKPNKETEDLAAKAKGPMSIFVSIDKQHLTLYSGDTPIAQTKVSTGTASHPTPTGVFSVIQKDRWHRSNIYGNAPMFYMQRITWSGVALHQGFVTGSPASHGCIRLPEAFAKQLWGLTQMGARVIVSRAELTPSTFSNPKLFVFKEPPPPPQPELKEQAETVGASSDPVKSAFNAIEGAEPGKTNARSTATDVAKVDPAIAVTSKPLKPGPIAVFVSRKEGKIFVRKGFEPLFDVPVAIENADQPLGTHVFTALAMNDDKSTMRWSLVTVPTNNAQPTKKVDRSRTEKGKKTEVAVVAPGPIKTTAAEALERITIPQDALDRIQALMSVGASLTISDQGLGPETGKGTDFIVLTR